MPGVLSGGEADLSAVEQVARRIAETVAEEKLVVEEGRHQDRVKGGDRLFPIARVEKSNTQSVF